MDDQELVDSMRSNALSCPTSIGALRATASEAGNSSGLRDMISTAHRMVSLGVLPSEAFSHAISSANTGTEARAVLLSAVRGRADPRSMMLGICEELADRSRLKGELAFGALQKYLTLSMLSGVILPSISLFGFVGYSLMYGSTASFALFAAAMLCVFPCMFALMQRRIADAYG